MKRYAGFPRTADRLGVLSGLGVRPDLGAVASAVPNLGLLAAGTITDFVVDPDQSLVTLTAATVETGNTLTLIIRARNAAGQNLAGKPITSVTIAPSGAASVSGSGDTNASGIATRTLTAGDVGTGNTVTVVCDGVTLNQVPTFDVTAVPAAGLFVDGLFVEGLFVEGLFV